MMAMRLFAALLLLRRFAADARAPGAPPPGICEIKDQAAEWRRTPLYGKYKRLDVFVSGIEGAGHHGVVNGFLAPVVQLVTVAHRTDCDDRTEMPFFGHPPARQGRRCALYALYGWERDRGVPSYPSERRLHPPDRLAALYLKSCFPGGYPPAWKGYGLDRRGDLKRCWRCGTWQATLDDAYARLLRSDRLDVSALVKGVTGMRVLVLWRDFTSCVFSHGLFDGNAHAHAVLLAAHAASMARDAAAMDPNDWRVLHYESQGLELPRRPAPLRATDARAGSADVVGGVVAAADAARNMSWRAPSRRKAQLAEQDSPARRAVRAVFAYFSHTWAVFDEPAQQLIPNDFRAAANATRAAAAPAPPSNGDACPPPEVEQCRHCPNTPFTGAFRPERFCDEPPAWDCCASRPSTFADA
ncbi:rRNA enoribonuclease [Aureococcus anophagefferens]|uniref:rRNA enoribonuclease n=1 Tax=Aureococcus anophagefferens TaxID=44056 RepID=A0ABR1G6F9_AURAN